MRLNIYLIASFLITSITCRSQSWDPANDVKDGSNEKFIYDLEGLKTDDDIDVLRFGLRLSEIVSIDTIQTATGIRELRYTLNKPIVLDGMVLQSTEEKRTQLSSISRSTIKSIWFLKRRPFRKKYGVSTKSGGVVIETNRTR